MMTQLHRALAALAAAGLAGAAFANCDSIVNYDYANAISANDKAYAAEIISSSPECFGGGPTTALVQINGTMFGQALAISSALAGRQTVDGPALQAAAGIRGIAAGNQAGPLNVWISHGEIDSRQRYHVISGYANGVAKNDMDIRNTVLGADYALSPRVVAGVSLAIDRGDGEGGNTDSAFAVNELRSRGRVIAPYVGWQINREFAFDASLGFGSGEVRTFTTNKIDSDRYFAAANLNYVRWAGNLQFTGRASLLHGVESYGDIKVGGVRQNGTDARNMLDQARLGAQVGYWMNGFMPFVGVGYVNDLRRSTTQFGAPKNPIGHDAWEWRVGASFFSLAHGLTGGVVFAQEEGRDKQKSHSFSANFSLRF